MFEEKEESIEDEKIEFKFKLFDTNRDIKKQTKLFILYCLIIFLANLIIFKDLSKDSLTIVEIFLIVGILLFDIGMISILTMKFKEYKNSKNAIQ